jgi:hypothetical protein
VLAVVAGLGWVTLTGLYDPGRTPVMAFGPLVLFAAGVLALGLLPGRADRRATLPPHRVTPRG